MRLRGVVLLGALMLAPLLSLGGCAKPRPAGPPVTVEPSQVEQRIYWASDLIDRRVSIDGYIGFDNGPNGQAIAMGPELNSQPFARGDTLIRVDIERGEKANQLNLPVLERQTLAGVPNAPATLIVDLAKGTWQDSAGKAHPLSEKVRLTGTLDYARVQNVGLISDPDSRSPNGRRLQPRLTDVVLEEPVR